MGTPNRLANETSLYLRQHANNPVNWYPWGPEALARAKQLDRPIFLSIGYSACHWCHVMEHESFEDEATAKILNEHYVSVKVDREERPDLDTIYMTSLQLLTREGGGWPMSMWLTPDLKPFYAGTYFPPHENYGRPSFQRVLLSVADAWKNRRADIGRTATELTQALQQYGRLDGRGAGDPDPELLRNAVTVLRRMYDSIHGGFGSRPKFPHPMELRVLLRAWRRFGDTDALAMAKLTFDRMARGGMYDQVGGGFHRYSVDARWLVPHFEKMLYDNALLATAYTEGFQATQDPYYRQTITETLDYVLREMTSSAGGFYSTQDADSEGEEGKFYVWSKQEILDILGAAEGELFASVYDITDDGNFEGHNIPNRSRTDEQESAVLKVPVEELRTRLAASRKKLYEVRAKRVWPGRDEKILTAWNGLMIDAMARAGAALDEPRYAEAAERAAGFVLERLRSADGRLLRTCGEDGPGKLNGYLEDYAYLIEGLVSLYESTFRTRWLKSAVELADDMVKRFADPTGAGFFYTGNDHEALIARTKDTHDGSTPAGNSMAASALLRLASLTGRSDLRAKADETLRAFRGQMKDAPHASGQLLMAADFAAGPVQEFAVVGDAGGDETRRVLRTISTGFRPNKVVALRGRADGDDPLIPLLTGKVAAGPVTTYVCQNYACREPLVGAGAVEKALG
jgi:uncharacterized protein YyaL (SSP411 family)